MDTDFSVGICIGVNKIENIFKIGRLFVEKSKKISPNPCYCSICRSDEWPNYLNRLPVKIIDNYKNMNFCKGIPLSVGPVGRDGDKYINTSKDGDITFAVCGVLFEVSEELAIKILLLGELPNV